MMDIDLFDKIFVDVDGCLLDSVEAMVRLLNEKHGTNAKSSDIVSWNFNEVKSDLTTKDIEDLFNNPKFFEIVEFYDGAIEFLTKYRHKIILFSKGNCDNIKHKREFFDAYGFSDITLIGFPLNISKGFLDMQYNGRSLFIDDCTTNLMDSNANLKVQFKPSDVDTEWSRDWNGMVIKNWLTLM